MHRILLRVGPITIYSYGLMLALAFIIGTYLAQKRAAKEGINTNILLDLIFYILISSIVGARALFVALNWNYYREHLLDILKVWEGGLVFYGGLLLAFIVTVWFLKKHKLSFWKIADIISPSLAIGIAIGRIGCFLNGCCYGKISSQWGVSFPGAQNSPAFAQQVLDGLIPPTAQCSLPVIPTQLYDSLSGIVLFLMLLILEKHKKFEGYVFSWFLLMYSISRFIIEGFRYYEPNFILFDWMTVSQLISVILFLVASFLLLKKSRTPLFH